MMKILMGNSVGFTASGQFRIESSIPVEFDDLAVFQISVPPTSPPESAAPRTADSLLSNAEVWEAREPAFIPPVYLHKEPAAAFAGGSPSSAMSEEYLKPESLDWAEDFTNEHSSALSDWPL